MILTYKILIFIILIFILYIIISKSYNFYLKKKIEKIVNESILIHKKKQPYFNINFKLKNLGNLWTKEYLIDKIGSNIIKVTNMKENILNFFKGTEEVEMRFDLFIELLESNNKLYYAQRELDDVLKKDIYIPDNIDKEIICNVVTWIGSGEQFTPLHFDHDDGYLCIVKGYKKVRLIHPKYTNLIKPYKTLMYSEFLSVDELKNNNINFEVKEYNLRSGDILFIPAGWWHDVKSSKEQSIAYTIWLNSYEGVYDYDKIIKKLEILQFREIHKFIKPKSLKTDEIKKLWDSNIINGNNWEKNLWILNPLYSEKYD